MANRMENFLHIEIESPDRSESPLEKIKHDYFELLYRLKNKMSSKDKASNILSPLVEYAFNVLRTLFKTIKSFDDKKTTESLMNMASMDKRSQAFERTSNPSSGSSNYLESEEAIRTSDSNTSQTFTLLS